MTRRRRRSSPRERGAIIPSAERTPAAAAPPSVDAYILSVDELRGLLTQDEARLTARSQVKGVWREFLPIAAEHGARLLAEEQGWFLGLDFGAAELAEAPRRLRDLERVRAALEVSLERVERALCLHKDRIARRTRRLHRAVLHKLADEGLEPAPRRRLLDRSLALRREFAAFGDKQTARRRQTAALLGQRGAPVRGQLTSAEAESAIAIDSDNLVAKPDRSLVR